MAYEEYPIWLSARTLWIIERLKERTGATTLAEVIRRSLAAYLVFAVAYKKRKRVARVPDDIQGFPELLTILSVAVPPGISKGRMTYGVLRLPAKTKAAFRRLYIQKTDEHSFVVENALSVHYNLLEHYAGLFPSETIDTSPFERIEFIESKDDHHDA
jgi:hypothetical protein